MDVKAVSEWRALLFLDGWMSGRAYTYLSMQAADVVFGHRYDTRHSILRQPGMRVNREGQFIINRAIRLYNAVQIANPLPSREIREKWVEV